MNVRNVQRNRLKMKKNSGVSRLKPSISDSGSDTLAGNMSAQSLPLIFNSLADLDHPQNLNLDPDETGTFRLFSNISIRSLYVGHGGRGGGDLIFFDILILFRNNRFFNNRRYHW
jgi:hypothetical protein